MQELKLNHRDRKLFQRKEAFSEKMKRGEAETEAREKEANRAFMINQ
jgi:hypothetical protein